MIRDVKCWMIYWDDAFCDPIWARSEAEAILTFQSRDRGIWETVSISETRRIPEWDNRDSASITPRDWFALGGGYGVPCVVCDELVYEETGSPWYNLGGDVIHGPGHDEMCLWEYWDDGMYVSRETLEALERAFGHDALVYALNGWKVPTRWQRLWGRIREIAT